MARGTLGPKQWGFDLACEEIEIWMDLAHS